MGRKLLCKLAIKIDSGENTVTWDNASIPMKNYETLQQQLNKTTAFLWSEETHETKALKTTSDRIKRILEAKYDKANLQEVVTDCDYLTIEEQEKLLQVLQKHEHLFDGTLGSWDTHPYNIELKPDATPYHAHAFPILNGQEAML